MAIAKGKESKEAVEFTRYIGIAPVTVVAVNPNKEQHEKIFNTTLNEAPIYVTEQSTSDGQTYKNARISIIVKPITDKLGFDMPVQSISLFVQNRYRTNKDNTKVQVIDKYGRTAWGNIEDVKAKKALLDRNGNPLNIDVESYRPAYIGEEALTVFTREFLSISSPDVYDNNLKKFVPNTNAVLEECECRYVDLEKIFKGDFSEIMDAIVPVPTYKVRVMFGVKSDAESGKMYQTCCPNVFVRLENPKNTAFEKEIANMVNYATVSGRALNTEYEAVPVHEYTLKPTTITQTSEEFPTENSSALPWE